MRRSFNAKGDEGEEKDGGGRRERKKLSKWAERLVVRRCIDIAREGRSRWALRLVDFLAGGNSSLEFPWQFLPVWSRQSGE